MYPVKAQIGFGNPIPVHLGDVPAPVTRNKVAEPNILLNPLFRAGFSRRISF